MKGKPDVMNILQEVLKAELTAINQYFLHAEMCNNWGYQGLYPLIKKEAIDEMHHAEWLIERILYLEATPNMSDYYRINIGNSVRKQIENDLALEIEAVDRLNRGVRICLDNGDAASRELLQKILADEERHVDWLESQLHMMDEVGMENYLAQQIRGSG